MCMYGGPLEIIYNICTCMIGSFIEAHLLGSMEEDEECDYAHILINDSSAQGDDKYNCSVGKDNSNMCKDIVIETELM